MFGNDADDIPHDLQESATDGKRALPTGDPYQQGTLTEERHEWGVVRQDADLAVVGGYLKAFGLPVKDGAVRRNHRDAHHAAAILAAFSTASSMPPTM